MDLLSLTDSDFKKLRDDMEKEEKRRKRAKNDNIRNKTTEILKYLHNNPDLLKFIKHDSNSCNDENPVNGMYSCRKCFLLKLLKDMTNGYINNNYKMTIEINIKEIED